MPTDTMFAIRCFALVGLVVMLAACAGVQPEARYPTGLDRAATDDIYERPDSIFGEGGIRLFGRSDRGGDANGIGVNAYLWRASLDTISFMPLASADPFGGVILTEWYAPPEQANERFKLNVFILGRELRSDAVQVNVFRQVRRNGAWQDADAAPETARGLEDAILTRARQLRVSGLQRN